MPGRVTLQVREGPLAGTAYDFPERTTALLGRSRECTIQIPMHEERQIISRMHCLLDINPPDIRVRDFGSLNGTDVNGKRIGSRPVDQSIAEAREEQYPEYDLQDGDTITLGETVLHVEVVRPVYCEMCDGEIPDDHQDESHESDDGFVCDDCWKRRRVQTRIESSRDQSLGDQQTYEGGAQPADSSDRSLSDQSTFGGGAQPADSSDRSLGDQSTFGGGGESSLSDIGGRAKFRCAKCGCDVAAELRSSRRGDYVCLDCQSDPEAILRQLICLAQSGEPELAAINGYELLDELGRGGMGAVYLARHNETDEKVALKVMLPKVAADDVARQRFLREISVTKSLTHRHIVELKDFGCSAGTFFFTLEYCEGSSVDQLMKKRGGTLSLRTAVGITCQALAGLDYAHRAELEVELADGSLSTAHGAVHRDLSPHNLFLSKKGGKQITKVGDFGLSKAFDTAGLSGQTCTGSLSGKPCFMPREQVINFRFSTPEVDVWGMAASLYNMLTGVYPRNFPRTADPWQVALTTSAVPIRERNSSIPKRLAEVIDTALIDKPAIKIKTAAELHQMLRKAMQ